MKRNLMAIVIGFFVGSAAAYLRWLVLPANFLGAFVMYASLAYCIGGAFFLAFEHAPHTKN